MFEYVIPTLLGMVIVLLFFAVLLVVLIPLALGIGKLNDFLGLERSRKLGACASYLSIALFIVSVLIAAWRIGRIILTAAK